MSSRDLTLRRSTDDRGNTVWQPSPLIQAAWWGKSAVTVLGIYFQGLQYVQD